MGLNICKKIVEACGGEIYYDSTYKSGACFCFDIQCESLPNLEESDKDLRLQINEFESGHTFSNLTLGLDLSDNLETLPCKDMYFIFKS